MNYRKVVRFSASVVIIPGLFLSVSSVAASNLILPHQFTHDGLTFESSLEVTAGADLPPVTISFEATNELDVLVPVSESNTPIYEEVLAEKIVSPSPKKLAIKPASSLPTLAQAVAEEDENVPTPTPTKAPLKTPTPTPQPKADRPLAETTTPEPKTEIPAPNPALPSYATNGSLSADVLFSMANQARAENGLPPFEKHPDVCAVAESRKPEIENEVYGNSSIHAGFRARNLPWRASENMISRGSETEAFSWWMNSSIHRAGILGGSKYACIACQNKTCAMIFSSLDPK